MKAMRSLGLHGGLLIVIAGLAYATWAGDGDDDDGAPQGVEIWGGDATRVQSVSFSSDTGKVDVDVRADEVGLYCVVSSERKRATSRDRRDDSDAAPTGESPADAAGELVARRYVSVSGCEKLREALAPLAAVRAIGPVGRDRYGEFALDEPKGELTVKSAGAERRLTIGGMTPGGGDYYVLAPESGRVYAIAGEVVRLLEYPDSRLSERELFNLDKEAIRSVDIIAPEGKASLIRMPDKVDGWSRAGSSAPDETAGNWVSKLSRLRIAEFEEKLPASAQRIFRVEYRGASKSLGFVELYRADEGAEVKYWARSATSRWFGSVLRSTGEQLAQDLAAVID